MTSIGKLTKPFATPRKRQLTKFLAEVSVYYEVLTLKVESKNSDIIVLPPRVNNDLKKSQFAAESKYMSCNEVQASV